MYLKNCKKRKIRKLLDLKVGDRLIFEVAEDNNVELKKETPLDIAYLKSLQSTLSEWESEEDKEIFDKV